MSLPTHLPRLVKSLEEEVTSTVLVRSTDKRVQENLYRGSTLKESPRLKGIYLEIVLRGCSRAITGEK